LPEHSFNQTEGLRVDLYQSLLFRFGYLLLALIIFSALVPLHTTAQKRRPPKTTGTSSKPDQSSLKAEHEKAKAELTKATEDYKKSLRDLLPYYQKNVKQLEGEIVKWKELYSAGVLSRNELQKKEQALVDEQAKIKDVEARLQSADLMLEQTLAEADVESVLAKSPTANSGIIERVAYFRFNGSGQWALSRASVIENFFYSTFHHQLPISAFGQTSLHNRLGFDHSNAMDVGLNPDSSEGRTLIAYLERAGIPFIAFRRAVPGAASGPHIHIGRPSRKI
jgi:hypothetical protein